MRRALFASLGFLASAGIASAATLDGRWAYDPADCTADFSDGIMTVNVAAGTIGYYESACTITTLTPIGTMESAWNVTATCSGEGMVWERETILAIDGEGTPRLAELDLTDGYVVIRTRCGK